MYELTPVEGVTVTGRWSDSGEDIGTASATTDRDGTATLTSERRKGGDFDFCVTSLSGDRVSDVTPDGADVCHGYPYDDGADDDTGAEEPDGGSDGDDGTTAPEEPSDYTVTVDLVEVRSSGPWNRPVGAVSVADGEDAFADAGVEIGFEWARPRRTGSCRDDLVGVRAGGPVLMGARRPARRSRPRAQPGPQGHVCRA